VIRGKDQRGPDHAGASRDAAPARGSRSTSRSAELRKDLTARKRSQVKHATAPDPIEEKKRRDFAVRQSERERAAGLDDDAAARWLADHEATVAERESTNETIAATAPKGSAPGARETEQDRRARERQGAQPGDRPAGRSRPLARSARLDGDCEHVEATIALEGGALSHFYCLRCGARREP
jgi:hypothetical protein